MVDHPLTGWDMEEIRKNYDKVNEMIPKQDERIQSLLSSAFQLANFYFVFQGVILTSIFNSSGPLTSTDRAFLFCLSLLAAIPNLFVIIHAARSCRSIMNEQDIYFRYCGQLRAKLAEGRENDRYLPKAINQLDERMIRRRIYLVLCEVFLLLFTLLTLVGCWVLHREENHKEFRTEHSVNHVGRLLRLCDGGNCITLSNLTG